MSKVRLGDFVVARLGIFLVNSVETSDDAVVPLVVTLDSKSEASSELGTLGILEAVLALSESAVAVV